MFSAEQISSALKRYWGYDAFRPKQEAIVRDILAGRDVCVVMPTGGGKSLCYQLPAALHAAKTAIVVSPLIALMQDQVAQLKQMAIPAGALNSGQGWNEQRSTEQRAERGDYRLLYLSPERLARKEVTSWLRKLPISFFVIDEAHCISEWGHEFRPDYRELKLLRKEFPDKPIAAFTASATQRVRHDIIEQLQLQNPGKFIASFHRPNLDYKVLECNAQAQEEQLVAILKKHKGSPVIVYSPTIKRVATTVDQLKEAAIAAIGYHAKMDAAERARNQARWMDGEVNVLVGTVAFGLGINKPDVRAVVHLSLPKSIEQYYQEAGRAGRDGQRAECFMLWQKRDTALLAHFIEQIEDEAEKARGWQRYRDITGFASSKQCRHKRICAHFGESVKWERCGACDVCLGTSVVAKPAASTMPPSTPDRRERKRKKKSATARVAGTADPSLLQALKDWRLTRARGGEIPAFVIFHDSVLAEISAAKPRTLEALYRIKGIGENKLERYGDEILRVVAKTVARAS
jgi:ATP-dependent DNA helicase RecQ